MDVVFSTTSVGDACRVLLLLLAETMTDAGRVSVPRDQLAVKLGISERRVSSRIAEAVDAGLLTRSGGGFRGCTASFDALLPKGDGARHPIEPKGCGSASPFSVTLSAAGKGDACRHPNAGTHAGASQTETRRRGSTAADYCDDHEPEERSDEVSANPLAPRRRLTSVTTSEPQLRTISGVAS